MSRIKEFVNRGVRLIVTDVPESASTPSEIPPEAFAEPEPKPVERSEVAADVDSFAPVYEEAGIAPAGHGYGVDKVSEMLTSKHISHLAREVKATAVLAALEAAHVPLKDVVQDAVRRDRALDAFEQAKGNELEELRLRTDARIQAIKDEIDAFLKERNSELESLKQAEAAAREAFARLQTRKRREEERLFDVVSHFFAGMENPITTTPGGAASAPPKPDPAGKRAD